MPNKKSIEVQDTLGADKNSLQKHTEFLFITEADIRLLSGLYKVREKFLPKLVDIFYTYLMHFSGIKDILTTLHAEKHRAIFKDYLEQLLSGNYTTEYITNRINIGLFNYENKIEPWMYIEAYGKIVHELAEAVGTTGLNKDDSAKAMAAIFKGILLDITFAVGSYYYENTFEMQKICQERVEEITLSDLLTSLPNRKASLRKLKRLIESVSLNDDKKIALIMISIDKFEYINEFYGYDKADLILKEVARRLSSIIKLPDIRGRLDGNKFMIVVYDIEYEEAVSSIIDKIDGLFTQPIEVGEDKVMINLCKGISIFPDEADNTDELIKIAELSLKEVKKAGSSNAMLYSIDLHHKVVDALKVEKEIEKAFENKEFVLYYQPKINIAENIISGAEALIRWNHPVKGVILPGKFIPVLEETGLIVDVGEWVIKELVRQVNLWNAKGMDLKVSFNASSLQLAKNDFAERLISIARDANVDPSRIEVEITESALMQNIASTIGKLTLLKSQGFGISIDDFGTGYSSLSYLQKLPIDVLKIDISFIRNLLISKESVTITHAIIVLAKTLAKRTIAEGVNYKEEIHLLQELGCDEVQGFYYSKPIPPPLFEKYIDDFNRQTFT